MSSWEVGLWLGCGYQEGLTFAKDSEERMELTSEKVGC